MAKTKLVLMTMVLLLAGCIEDGPSLPATPASLPTPSDVVVIGQKDLESTSLGTSATTMNSPSTLRISPAGRLYVGDVGNSRIMGFDEVPTSSGAAADFVLGQPDFDTGTFASSPVADAYYPIDFTFTPNQMLVVDNAFSRALVFSSVPTTHASSSVAIGSANTTSGGNAGCNRTDMNSPFSIASSGGKIVIGTESRILIYNSVPIGDLPNVDVVLGSNSYTSCGFGTAADRVTEVWGVWTDGTRVVASDTQNNRVLIWSTFPTGNAQSANIVLGQPDMISGQANRGSTPTASTMSNPWGIWSDGVTLAVADAANHRILIWKTFPTTNGQAADLVIGQPDFATVTSGTGPLKFNYPSGVLIYRNKVIVGDSFNNRVLVYKKFW